MLSSESRMRETRIRFDERRLETERWRGARHRYCESRRETATPTDLTPPRQSSTLHLVTRYHATSDSYDVPKFRVALYLNANWFFGDRMAVSLGPLGGLDIPDRHGTEECGRVQGMLERLWHYIDLRDEQSTRIIHHASFRCLYFR